MPAGARRSRRRKKDWPARQRNSSHKSARQLQAHVRQRLTLLATFILEGNLDLRPIALDLAVFQLHVELGDLCHAEVAQRLRRSFDRCRSSFLPGLCAGPDQLDDLVDALCHVGLLLIPGWSLPNGSRLSCGRNARGRKAVQRQKKRLAREATQFFPTGERPSASSAC